MSALPIPDPSGLSAAELAFIPEAKLRRTTPPVRQPDFEIDVTVSIPGQGKEEMTFAIYGEYVPASRGRREGGVPIEPDEPAYFDIERVMLGESDVSGDLPRSMYHALALLCKERWEERE